VSGGAVLHLTKRTACHNHMRPVAAALLSRALLVKCRYDAFGKGILSSTNPEDFSKLSVKSKDPKVSAFVSKLDQFLSQNNIDSRSSRQLSSSQGSSRSEERDSIADGTSYDRGAAVNLAEPHTSPRQDVALSCANNDSIQAKVDRIAALKAKSELLQVFNLSDCIFLS